MLRKCVFKIIMILTVFMAVQSFGQKAVNAQDVWVYQNTNYTVYAMTETYERLPSPSNYSIKAKLVYPSGDYVINKYAFIREGMGRSYTWYCKVNDGATYRLNLENELANDFPYHVSLFRYCNNNL